LWSKKKRRSRRGIKRKKAEGPMRDDSKDGKITVKGGIGELLRNQSQRVGPCGEEKRKKALEAVKKNPGVNERVTGK